VVVATPTASGKSLIYNLAVARTLLAEPAARALYLFPIKALSRDQFKTIADFLAALEPAAPLHAAIYDGDTTPHERSRIRANLPQVIVTNPDMLHYALLPFHAQWEAFWRELRFVVVDEMHTYRGVFGSHVAQILRRLQRICRLYGSHPRFILLSATIANPGTLAAQLIARAPAVVERHGAPQAERHFVFLHCDESPSSVAARLVVQAARLGLKTIAFTQSRKLTELVHMSVLRMAPELRRRVSSYRAGFLPEERRAIERNLASGSLAAVISTSALEMGIDIGALDLCILVGYPGTVMTTWQRGGRVGRAGQESAIVLVPQADALDQYIVQHPDEFLDSRYEVAVVDPENPEILKAHLPCAAAEIPLARAELSAAAPAVQQAAALLTERGDLRLTADGDRWLCGCQRPERRVDLRSVGNSFTILTRAVDKEDRWVPLGKSDGIRALKECHPGAVYLHRGRQYQVASLDLANRVVRVENRALPYFTRIKSDKETEILEVLASKPVENFVVRLGRLRVTETIVGYEKRRLFSQELLDTASLELPPQTFETIGFWLEIEAAIGERIRKAGLHFMGGIHAVEHAAISMFPLFALCDRNDIGGIATTLHPQVAKSVIFIYDGYPGGVGLAARGYDIIGALLEKTRALIAACPCEGGCPACIHSPKCGAGNKPLDKAAALATLEFLLGVRSLEVEAAAEGQPAYVAEEADAEQQAPAAWTPRIGFLDLETRRLAAEVGGWHNKHLMRISVAVLYDTASGDYHVFREEDVARLVEHLRALDLVVGFNVKGFDYGVLQAYTTFDLKSLPTLDILEKVREQAGFRLSLDHLAAHTLGKGKAGDGLQAVAWFRDGNWEALTDYCREDVALTRALFEHARTRGYLVYADRSGTAVRLPTTWRLEDAIGTR
jgi:DEAD/DEAH box helicase domain-containing protein